MESLDSVMDKQYLWNIFQNIGFRWKQCKKSKNIMKAKKQETAVEVGKQFYWELQQQQEI